MELKNAVNDIKSYIDNEAVKNKIANDLGLKFKNNKCLCFKHSESNPSMSYDPKKKKYKCFSCGASYDIFTLSILNKVFTLVPSSNHIFTPGLFLVFLYLLAKCSPSSFLYSKTMQFPLSFTPT